jgi:hypothetical protein
MPGMSRGAESRHLPRRPSWPSPSCSYLPAIFGSHFPFAHHILLLLATWTPSARLLLLPPPPRTLLGPARRAPQLPQPAPAHPPHPARPPLPQPSPPPGMGGSALRHPASHLRRLLRSAPRSPALSPAGAPARRRRCQCPGCLAGPSPAVYRAALLALALLLIPPGCFRQPLPLRAPHPPPPPRDQDPERTPHTAEAAAHPPSPWPSPARLPAPPAQPASGSGGMWGLVLSHLASHY